MTSPMQTLWVVSELYYPERTSTGHFLTGIAEGLAGRYRVRALAAQPTYSARGTFAPAEEARNGVDIIRCRSTRLDKNNLFLRVFNILSISTSMFLVALRRFQRGDVVLVVTNPPLMPYLILLACRIRSSRMVLLVHDVYPEVLVAVGGARKSGLLTRLIASASLMLYRRVERIVVLGRDMRALLLQRDASLDTKMRVIPNWGDTDIIAPRSRRESAILDRLHLRDKFVVQYLGNMGRTHALELLLDVALALAHRTDIHFIFCGAGARRAMLEERVVREAMQNVTVLPPCSAEELNAHLAACDLSVVSFVPGMSGVSVPSRMYNVLASGRPLLAIGDEGSELFRLVEEEQVGWTVRVEHGVAAVVAVIEQASTDRDQIAGMSVRSRRAAEARYTRAHVVEAFAALFHDMTLAGKTA